ncbi:hypothetical protein C8R48DRAFT_725511 [Suillus tomentosus]|nr:hypothetical protein C8R48DRAFT_725511 [Suillus tomentosus]
MLWLYSEGYAPRALCRIVLATLFIYLLDAAPLCGPLFNFWANIAPYWMSAITNAPCQTCGPARRTSDHLRLFIRRPASMELDSSSGDQIC